MVKELIASQEANYGKHDVFLRQVKVMSMVAYICVLFLTHLHTQLDRTDDKFALIADYFSKLPFGVPNKSLS